MFKSQMKCQKILCFVALIMAAILFVYAIGFVTSLYDQYFFTLDKDRGYDFTRVEGTQFFWELQTKVEYKMGAVVSRELGFVDQFVIVAIIGICIALVLFITNTHKRRLYYIGNYISTGLFAAYNVGVAAWVIARLVYFKGKLAGVNLEQLKTFCEERAREYNPQASVRSLDLGIALAVIVIVVAIAVVLNLVWKIMLQKRENKLLNQSSHEEVAVNG